MANVNEFETIIDFTIFSSKLIDVGDIIGYNKGLAENRFSLIKEANFKTTSFSLNVDMHDGENLK